MSGELRLPQCSLRRVPVITDGTQVPGALFGTETGGHLFKPAVTVKGPYNKMKVGKIGVTRIAAARDGLAFFDSITHLHQYSVFLQMPVPCPGTVRMLNNNIVGMHPVRFFNAALAAVFFQPHHNTISCCAYNRSGRHFKIQCSPSFMRKLCKIALYQGMTDAFGIGQVVNKGTGINDASSLKPVCFPAQRVVHVRTAAR